MPHLPLSPAAAGPGLRVPPALGQLLSRLPAYPGSVLMAGALNVLLAPHLPADVRTALQGRAVRIDVRDARLRFDFAWDGRRFAPRPSGQPFDVAIRASAHDFLQLAQRKQDPDTLFFSRRLALEGDTELGLVIKNTLDALELPVMDPREWPPVRALLRLLDSRAPGKPHDD